MYRRKIFFLYFERMAEGQEKTTAVAGGIVSHPIEQEITQSYIDYAMSVIVSRALPDTRD